MHARLIPLWLALAVLLSALLLALTALSSPALAQTPGDLLEKAIYTEETVGNLDEAMKLYEQVIAQGKTAQTAAAQAQYRLALCYQKKNMQAEATAAFETLIKDFPGETELVAKARKQVPSGIELLPSPWPDHEQLHINMKLASGLEIGTMIYRIDALEEEGKRFWNCSTRGLVLLSDASSFSSVLCEKESFAPLRSHWKHSLLGEADADYKESSVVIKHAGKQGPQTIEFTPPGFDNEQCVELFRRLPLKVGYKKTLTVITTLGGSVIPLGLEVPAKEAIEVPAGRFECYKLVLNIGQTFWISADEHRYLVRFDAGGVTAELAKVTHRKPDASEALRGDDFSLTLPKDWYSYSPRSNDEKLRQRTYLLDPRAFVDSVLTVRPKSKLKEDQQKSPAAWTQSVLDDFKRDLTGFQLREPGVQEMKIGDRSAAVIVADYTKGDKKMTLYGLAAFGEQNAANLRFLVAADKFDTYRSQFDEIIKSLEVK